MKRRLPAILKVLGLVVFVFGLSMLLPLAVSLAIGDAAQLAYAEAVPITAGTGSLAWLATRRDRQELRMRDGFLLVVLAPAFWRKRTRHLP